MKEPKPERINGIPCDSLKRMVQEVARDASKGKVKFQVATNWKGGVRSDSHVTRLELDGRTLPRKFAIRMDEPPEFLGQNTGPNPQEMLMAAFNACLVAGYVAGCALEGIELERLTVETEGELDLRGSLGLDASIAPGYEQVRYTVRIRGNGTPEQFQKIHQTVLATSPNRWNIANAIKLNARLLVESRA
jgi:uncharacterized OsmC-like protein